MACTHQESSRHLKEMTGQTKSGHILEFHFTEVDMRQGDFVSRWVADGFLP